MRVLIVAHGFPPIQNAGAERAAERVAKWLAEQGHGVEVFTIGSLDAAETRLDTLQQDNLTVHRLSFNIRAGDIFRNTFDNPLIGQALEPVLEKGQFDLVHMISGYLLGGQVARTVHKCGIPVVVTLTEYFYLCARLNLMHADSSLCTGPDSDEKCARCLFEEKRRYQLAAQVHPILGETMWNISRSLPEAKARTREITERRQMLKEVLESSDLVICPSRFIMKKYAEFGFDTQRFVFIQHGLKKAPAPPSPRPDQNECMKIGYIGQIKTHKGVDLLVQAAANLVDQGLDFSLKLWGSADDDPSYYKHLLQLANGREQIAFCGPFQGEQVWGVLNGMDVLIVPSRCYENCPTVILEAYKASLPVVATNLGGMAELVQHEKNGLVFEANNAVDLQKQLERLITHPDLIPELAGRIPYVKSSDEEAGEIFAQYQKILKTWKL